MSTTNNNPTTNFYYWPALRTLFFVSLGVWIGQTTTTSILLIQGYHAIWFGPELRRWSQSELYDEAQNFITQYEKKHPSYIYCKPSHHTDVEPDSERRIRKIMYFNPDEQKAVGIVRFGPDCEGPPRLVHGGCSAAFADQVCMMFAQAMGWLPCKVLSMSVQYKEVVPLGSQLGFEIITTTDNTTTKTAKFKMFSLIHPPSRVYVTATCTFEKIHDDSNMNTMLSRQQASL
jgi:hypothetical protein